MDTEDWNIPHSVPGHPVQLMQQLLQRMHVTCRNTGRMSAGPSGLYKPVKQLNDWSTVSLQTVATLRL